MILMNLGGRHIANEVSPSVHKMFNQAFLRRFFVFCVAFIATRDIVISLIIVLLFIILFKFLLNEESNLCIIPRRYIEVDTDRDGKVSEDEYRRALEILRKYRTG